MIERESIDGVAVMRLAHGKVNALDLELLHAITEAFTTVDSDEHRAVVLTGAGRALCAGVDLWRIIEGGPEYVRAFLPALNDAFLALFTVGKPVVAAVNGHAIAGGAILTSACDHRVMAAGTARIGVTELHVGVPFPVTALEILSYALGEQRAREAVISAATYQPHEARGFVDELVPAAEVVDRAIAVARGLAEQVPADTYRLTKAQLHASTMERIERLRPAYDGPTERLWIDRVNDGWLRGYMQRVVRSG